MTMDILSLLQNTLDRVIETFSHNWTLLLISILISAALKLYMDQDAISRFLRRNTKNSVLMATGVAVATPFCSCGTTAVILGMLASTVPWAPIVAFMVASPLTSPQELFYSAGLCGWPFAIAFFGASILLGLAGGAVAGIAESRGWLKDQAHVPVQKSPSLSLGLMGAPAPLSARQVAEPSTCCMPVPAALNLAAAAPSGASSCACSSSSLELPTIPRLAIEPVRPGLTFPKFLTECWDISKRL